MNWEEAEKYLYEMKQAYLDIGMNGMFGLLAINQLVERFERGERTEMLYEDIMNIG